MSEQPDRPPMPEPEVHPSGEPIPVENPEPDGPPDLDPLGDPRPGEG